MLEQIPAQRAALRLPRYAAFFARVESLSENPSRITATAIANLLGGKGVLHHRIPLGFLLSEAIIASTAAELSDALEESRHTRVLAAATGTWYGPLLGRFHANMLRLRARFERRGWIGRRSRFALRTISLALAAASLSAAR
ncbi:MAG TPA: hypothetical protein VKQ29_08395 [Aliidongia sp.]|nr:hypothetical protein [Aliidongia sp.]